MVKEAHSNWAIFKAFAFNYHPLGFQKQMDKNFKKLFGSS